MLNELLGGGEAIFMIVDGLGPVVSSCREHADDLTELWRRQGTKSYRLRLAYTKGARQKEEKNQERKGL